MNAIEIAKLILGDILLVAALAALTLGLCIHAVTDHFGPEDQKNGGAL